MGMTGPGTVTVPVPVTGWARRRKLASRVFHYFRAGRSLCRRNWDDPMAPVDQPTGAIVCPDCRRVVAGERQHEPIVDNTVEVEALRAQFAAFAGVLLQTQVAAEAGRDWGHMRAVILGKLSMLESTARKMAAGQPAYVPTYRDRVKALEEALTQLRTTAKGLIANWRGQGTGGTAYHHGVRYGMAKCALHLEALLDASAGAGAAGTDTITTDPVPGPTVEE